MHLFRPTFRMVNRLSDLHKLSNTSLLADLITGRGLICGAAVICAEIEKCRLLGSMFPQFGHLVHATCNRLLLFSLIPALGFVPLSLLSCVFLLALRKC